VTVVRGSSNGCSFNENRFDMADVMMAWYDMVIMITLFAVMLRGLVVDRLIEKCRLKLFS
jgi:hypothetical protein